MKTSNAQKKTQLFLVISVISTFVLFVALAWIFPDQPITPKGNSYIGKYGVPYTQSDYHTYLVLNRALFVSCLGLFMSFFAHIVIHPEA